MRCIWEDGEAGMESVVTFCISYRMALLLCRIYGCGNENAGWYGGCCLRLAYLGRWLVLLWSMLCASEGKETNEEKEIDIDREKQMEKEEVNFSIREDGVAGMDYVVCVWRIW